MGWSAGSQLADDMWFEVREYIPTPERKKVARRFIELVQDLDADDWSGDLLVEQDADLNYEEDEEDIDDDY